MGKGKYILTDPVAIAGADQSRERAIEELRQTDQFAVFIPGDDEADDGADEGGLLAIFSGRTSFMVQIVEVLTRELSLRAAHDFIKNHEETIERGDIRVEYRGIFEDPDEEE